MRAILAAVWNEGVIALAGVIVGATVTGVVQFVLASVDRRRDRGRLKRVLGTELRTLWEHLTLVLKHGSGSLPDRVAEERPEGFLPIRKWEQHQEAFAGSGVTDDEWEAVEGAYSRMTSMRYGLFAGVRYPTEDLRMLRSDLWKALTVLGHVSFPESLVDEVMQSG